MLRAAERAMLAERHRRAVEDLAGATDELAAATARVEGLADRGGPLNLARLALAVWKVGHVRSRGNARRRELEEIGREEVALFEEARLEVGRRYGHGTYHVCASWGHLEAWARWFEDLDNRHRWEIEAAGGVLMDHPDHDPHAAEEERRRQVALYGIHDPHRFGPDLAVPVLREPVEA